MSNLQIKGIDEGLYPELKQLAADENRSVRRRIGKNVQREWKGAPGFSTKVKIRASPNRFWP